MSGKTSSLLSISEIIKFEIMCSCGTLNTSIPLFNPGGKHSSKKIFTMHKGMDKETCSGETDPKIWNALNLEEHNIPLGEPRAKLIILWLAAWSGWMQTYRNLWMQIYMYLPINLIWGIWNDRGSYRLIRKVLIRKCMQNKVTKYSRRFLKSLVNLRFIMMVLFKYSETKAKLNYYMTGPFVNMIK